LRRTAPASRRSGRRRLTGVTPALSVKILGRARRGMPIATLAERESLYPVPAVGNL
jgi:hypothetical protein